MSVKTTIARTARGMRQGLVLQLSAIGAITAASVIAGLAGLTALNAAQLTAHWGAGLHMVVYLQHDVEQARVEHIRSTLADRAEVASVRVISSHTAYTRLKRGLGARSGLLEGIDRTFFPTSLEVQLDRTPAAATSPLVALLESLPEVEEVDHLGRWAQRLGSVAALLRSGLLIVALLVTLAGLYVIASTIRLGMFTRLEEIEIQRLLGATDRFVNAPFMLEGFVQGCVSISLALALLYAIYSTAAPRVVDALGPVLAGVQPSFLSPTQMGLALLTGGSVGLLGSRLAVARRAD